MSQVREQGRLTKTDNSVKLPGQKAISNKHRLGSLADTSIHDVHHIDSKQMITIYFSAPT